MKKSILLISFLVYCLTAFAQPFDNRSTKDKVREWKIAFITEKLALTSAEAQKFWPIYYTWEKELQQVRKAIRQVEHTDLDGLSNKDAEQLVHKHFELKQKELDLNLKYFEKFKTAIPPKKIAKLPRVEREFKRTLMQKLHGQRRGGR